MTPPKDKGLEKIVDKYFEKWEDPLISGQAIVLKRELRKALKEARDYGESKGHWAVWEDGEDKKENYECKFHSKEKIVTEYVQNGIKHREIIFFKLKQPSLWQRIKRKLK